MSQDVYVFNICVLKNYFGETFGDHYPYEIITGIIMVLRDSKVLDLKINLKSIIHEVPLVVEDILQMAQCSSRFELHCLISSYYPIFRAEYIELENTYGIDAVDARGEEWDEVKQDKIDEMISTNTKRWFCQIVDGLGSEESLYELSMAAHTWIIEFESYCFHSPHYGFTSFIDCIPTDTSYKPTSFTLPTTFWFE
jgi:hypothetical protein